MIIVIQTYSYSNDERMKIENAWIAMINFLILDVAEWKLIKSLQIIWERWTACWFSPQISSTPPRGTPWIRLTWLWRPSVQRYNRTRVSLCTSRKQPFQQTRVRWGDFPLIPNLIISHQVNKQKLRGMSVMPRGLRTTRQTHQHWCQTEPQPKRRRNRRFVSQHGTPTLYVLQIISVQFQWNCNYRQPR
jgi:hypothetical protein